MISRQLIPDGESEPIPSISGPLPPHPRVSQSGFPHHLKKSHLNHLNKPWMKEMSSNAEESESKFHRLDCCNSVCMCVVYE